MVAPAAKADQYPPTGSAALNGRRPHRRFAAARNRAPAFAGVFARAATLSTAAVGNVTSIIESYGVTVSHVGCEVPWSCGSRKA